MKMHYVADKTSYRRMTSDELRDSFLIGDLFVLNEIVMTYVDIDRTIVGSAVPGKKALTLSSAEELRAAYFAERREVGVINIGGEGSITVDGDKHSIANKDCLYIGRGSKSITFESSDSEKPAKFFIMSYPAHTSHPTRKITKKEANLVQLGSDAESNTRDLYQMICPGVAESCQIVMGITELSEGNVWNTMPPHTHERRSEVYMYFDFDESARLFHFMGEPSETRHLVLKPGDAAISPSWSIHAGSGTSNYSFIWCMGGENQAFSDMDFIPMEDLK